MLLTLLAFAVALGILITFHELGHYWAARWCGVRVERFSVGFGKVLAHRCDRHGTEWALSAIPLGGYVKMLDEPPAGASNEEIAESFNHKSVWQRIVIVAAGPVANLVLAALLYAALGMMGTREPEAYVAQPQAGTAAAMAGFSAGDRILSIDGRQVDSWNEVRWHLLDRLSAGGEAYIQVQAGDGRQLERRLELQPATIDPDAEDPLRQAGLSLLIPAPGIRQADPGGAGAQAGLQAGDILVAVGSIERPSARQAVEEISRHPEQPLEVRVLRNGAEHRLQVTPRAHQGENGTIGRIGVMLTTDFPMVDVRYGPLESLHRGIVRTGETIMFSLKMMGRMVTGDVSLRNISGPVTIADYAGQTARVGLAAYVGFLALISVSIGVLNLLPIPMLDGGHLMYYLLEILRGKPVPDAWMEYGQRLGIVLLAGLMGLAFFNDFSRLFS
ncbi:RIP metalloprotease RseP [Paracandidimonas soli]|uniref:Zinc metalloprotease n=1 Tax=Paracandidimonas soli TaxID=1917182 RepID=A0A4V2VSC1_9BURK|nr:RIP metalloprotease RseP [Paracandidimonas soli]TCV01780.1 regulator of sigma E protease [Paracandidimonas soli]